MKVALSIEVTDEQRNILANLENTRRTKALASRDDVRAFIEGVLSNLTAELLPIEAPKQPADKSKKLASYDVGDGTVVTVETGPAVQSNYDAAFYAALNDKDRETYNRLKAEGQPDGFIRGYFYIERKKFRGNKPLRDSEKLPRAGGSTEDLRHDDRSDGEDEEAG